MARPSNAAPAAALAALSGLLVMLTLPQLGAAWLTAPRGLDHTHPETLNADEQQNYRAALRILPQASTQYALGDSMLRDPNLTTLQREGVIDGLSDAAARAPGNAQIWYLLAAALETELANPVRRELWDHAMSMSLLTGPFARDLTEGRAAQMIAHWDVASPDLKNLWQEQMINLWGTAPDDIYKLYMAASPAGQKILFDTLGEVPTPESQE